MSEVIGKVHFIGAEQQVSASYKKRELVVKTEETYPQTIAIEFAQDKTVLLDFYNVGESVKVSINLGGREWINPAGETKYFNSIKGWRIEKINSEAPTAQQMPSKEAFDPATNFKEEEHDDLPF